VLFHRTMLSLLIGRVVIFVHLEDGTIPEFFFRLCMREPWSHCIDESWTNLDSANTMYSLVGK
jgi:hypothetical protein